VVTGNNLIANQQYAKQVFVFRRNPNVEVDDDEDTEYFTLVNRIVTKDIEVFQKVCSNF